MGTSVFSGVPQGVPVEIFKLIERLKRDQFPNKVDLGGGILGTTNSLKLTEVEDKFVLVLVYRTEDGKSWVLPVVQEAEQILAADETLTKEYLPPFGLRELTDWGTRILLGDDSPAILERRVVNLQSVSSISALRMGAELLVKQVGLKTIYYPDPTWDGHDLIFSGAGFVDKRRYRYWCPSSLGIDLEGLLEDLDQAPENSCVVLHGCAHNPTGCDFSKEQWKRVADVIEKRKLFPIFDIAYQGFASGDLDEDAWAIRYFVSRGLEFMSAQTFSKNFGLYSERIGNLIIVINDPCCKQNIESQLTMHVRGLYSSPPSHGARIITLILKTPRLRKQWLKDLRTMSDTIKNTRAKLKAALLKLGTPGNWDHITSQIGMFCYTGLSRTQSEHMVAKHHVYMLSSGRISIGGINRRNVDYVAGAIHETVTNVE